MANVNLLNTSTVNFQDLLGNGKNYRVPPYQRDYSWGPEQWEDLWLDIDELQPDTKKRHYMGAVVIKASSDREFLIIDGQQRIATLTILGLAIIGHLTRLGESEPENRERANALRARYIGEKDPASLTEISKLVLNERDNGFFQDYLVQLRRPTNPRGLPQSNKLLWNCFEFFEKQILGNHELVSDGFKLAELLSEVIARRLLFILITVDDEISAYTVFETLNARGLELTTTDLLKNYLFSRLHATGDLQAAQRRWQKLISTVRQERFGDFLRYYYLMFYPKIRTGRLFNLVRDEVRKPEEVLDLLTALEYRAELFEALRDPNHSLWLDRADARPYIKELNLFRVRQVTPLLFAAFEKLSAAEFVRTLKLVSVISFRYTVISRLNTNDLEPVYHYAANAVLKGNVTTAAGIFEKLRSIYVVDDKFAADFEQLNILTSGGRKKLVKYILCRLETDFSGINCDYETDPATIEHILPENPQDQWENSIPREDWDEYIYRIGNLTLLEAPLNRQVADQPYQNKLDAYNSSHYRLTSTLTETAPHEWSIAQIIKRQGTLAKRAKHIWRSDF